MVYEYVIVLCVVAVLDVEVVCECVTVSCVVAVLDVEVVCECVTVPYVVAVLDVEVVSVCVTVPYVVAVLDVDAFERLLGPCMDVLKRNIHEYEEQLAQVFGSDAPTDLR